jgi:hypothetical protein
MPVAAQGYEQPRWNIVFNRMPPQKEAVRVAYAPDSGITVHGSAVTRFRYLATNTVRDGLMETGRWQPAALPPGEYIVRASVRDYSGNEGVGPREIRVRLLPCGSRGAAAFALGVHVFQRPHFDAAEARPREVAGDAHGFVAVAGDDQVEAGQQFAGFGERAIEHAAVAIAHAQGLRGVDRLQLLRGQQRAFGLQLVGVGEAVAHQRVEFFDGQGLQQGRLDVDQKQVLLHGTVLAGAGCP